MLLYIAGALTVWLLYAATTKKKNLPPGPPGLPVVGNLFELSIDLWVKCSEWKHTYGPLVYLNVAGQGILVINEHKAAVELFERRSSIYSDRPRFIVGSEILCGGLIFIFSCYGDFWRRMRRAAHEGIHNLATSFQPVQEKESVFLVHRLIENPNKWSHELERTSASTILSVVYDLPLTKSFEDPTVVEISAFTDKLVRVLYPGAYLVEFFTWMMLLPRSIAGWKRDVEDEHKRFSTHFRKLFDDVRARMRSGDERSSFCSTLIREKDRHGLNEDECSWLAATAYAAGAETTTSALEWFILAMAKYPDVQRKCQEELDAVVGRSRMPTFADSPNLPYMNACVREVLRWRTVAPFGVPHQSNKDDFYRGYFIPKGTICISNIWFLNVDPEVYGPDAADFNPARHLDSNGRLRHGIADTKDGHVSYGYGPRICVGRRMATNSLFINISSMLWALNVKPCPGDRELSEEFIKGRLVLRPEPFNVDITPRFPDIPNIVEACRELSQGET
ncbi:cytochrome P450 [Collybia nuda]|uniref:Cytochrome P450 n=1 Tax=Collybia nuda TaxID=64659 RepID=A0A9P5Y6Q6_9AGAR|nr:cytochrome P450 [Collybia nuda]